MKQQDFSPVLVCGEIGLIHSFGIAGIPVHAGSEYEENLALYSCYTEKKILFPSYESDDFIEELMKFGSSQPTKQVLLTDDDQAVLSISRNREILKKHYRFLLPDPDVVEQIQNKEKFYKKATRLKLPVPDSYTISCHKELEKVKKNISYPCILKPSDTKDWQNEKFSKIAGSFKKAIRCEDMEELMVWYDKLSKITPKVILQEFIEGEDHRHYSINMYLDKNSNLKGYYIYQKLRMYPIGAGRGSFFETIHSREILNKAIDAAKKFTMRGLVNIQFKKDKSSGALKLIEMEPRLSISSFLGPASGMNLAEQYYHDLTGRETSATNYYEAGIKYSDLLRDIKAFAAYRKQKKMSFSEWLRSYSGHCVFNGWKLGDPSPLFKNFWFVIRNRLRKTKKRKQLTEHITKPMKARGN